MDFFAAGHFTFSAAADADDAGISKKKAAAAAAESSWIEERSKMNSFQVIAWPAATTCPHHVRKPGRKWVREQSAHLSPFHKGGARHHREQDPGEEVGRQEKGGEEGSQHRGKKSLATVDTIIVKKHPLDPR